MKKHLLYAALLFIGLLAIYSAVVFDSRQLLLDDPVVVAPMEQVHSLNDYQKLVNDNVIYDVQPVRDLSLWINSNHAGNLVIWFVAVVCFWGCLFSLRVPQTWCYSLVVLFAFNPLFVSSVAWLSARKHLLSLMFTAILTLILIRESRKKKFAPSWAISLLVVVLYFLAGLSQPINLLWPVFALIYVWSSHGAKVFKNAWVVFSAASMAIIGFAIAAVNMRYYEKTYALQAMGGKYVSDAYNSFYWRSLAWGRMFFQIILPVQTGASDHNPYSWISQAGLILIAIFAVILWKLKIRDAKIWAFAALLAVLPVTLRMTQIFAMDNYLLFAAFCIYVVLGLCLKKIDASMSKAVRAVVQLSFVAIACVFSLRSYVLASAWNNDMSLWEMSYQVEPTKKSATEYAQMLLAQNQLEKGFEIAMDAKRYPGFTKNYNSVLAKAIYLHPHMPLNEKYRLFNEDENEWSVYYAAALKANEGKMEDACMEIHTIEKYAKNLRDFDNVVEPMAAEAIFFCKAEAKSGTTIAAVLKSVRSNKWNQALFEKRARELGVSVPSL